jgi:hypothetical protein
MVQRGDRQSAPRGRPQLLQGQKWTKDGTKVDRMLFAGNNLEKAKDIFAEAIKHRPRIRLTIRQRTRVLQRRWPA